MAAPTESQWKLYLAKELTVCVPDLPGCEDCKLNLGAQVAFLWDSWSDKTAVSLRLQYLYAKRSALDWLLGQLWPLTNGALGPLNARCKDRFDNLLKLRELTEVQLAQEEKRATFHGSVIGDIERLTPIEVEAGCPDPSDRRYRGDPVLR